MSRNTHTLNCQRRTNKFRIGFALASLLVVFGSSGIAQATTVPFTFGLTTDTFTVGVPSATTLTLPGTLSGSGSFAPFGSAIYTEAGTITFAVLPSGEFVPFSVMNNFTASFNGELTHSRGQTP